MSLNKYPLTMKFIENNQFEEAIMCFQNEVKNKVYSETTINFLKAKIKFGFVRDCQTLKRYIEDCL